MSQKCSPLLDEHLKEIADLTAQAFSGGEPYDALWVRIQSIESTKNIAWLMFNIGGDWALHTEYCHALLRATILEGELYILTIEKPSGKKEIASWVSWFPPGAKMFATQVFSMVSKSILEADTATRTVKLNELWNTTTFLKNLNLK